MYFRIRYCRHLWCNSWVKLFGAFFCQSTLYNGTMWTCDFDHDCRMQCRVLAPCLSLCLFFYHVTKTSQRCFLSRMVKTLYKKKQKLYFTNWLWIDQIILTYCQYWPKDLWEKKNVVDSVKTYKPKLELNCEWGKKLFSCLKSTEKQPSLT